MKFNVGDIVRFNLGEPKMTIEGFEGRKIRCVWFEKRKDSSGERFILQRETFSPENLVK